jgi:8-oxo-dGTP pyrophosphatase MutT (NUDIX family)
VRVDRPPPGEELNEGEVTEPRPAATLVLLRDSPQGPEVLLVQRNPAQRFMGGAWVFPGGALHADDANLAAAAVRELREEAGIELPAGAPVLEWTRWITPDEVKIRFDTWFFVAEAPAGAEPTPDGAECLDARWLRPAAALEALADGRLMLVFPTIKHLEALTHFDSVAAALENARRGEVVPVQPRVVVHDGSPHVVMPGEPGYDER